MSAERSGLLKAIMQDNDDIEEVTVPDVRGDVLKKSLNI
jgi:hypothetical protein